MSQIRRSVLCYIDPCVYYYIFKARSWHPKQQFENSTFVGYPQLTSCAAKYPPSSHI
jgi:hypothetical protein